MGDLARLITAANASEFALEAAINLTKAQDDHGCGQRGLTRMIRLDLAKQLFPKRPDLPAFENEGFRNANIEPSKHLALSVYLGGTEIRCASTRARGESHEPRRLQ